VLVVRLLYGGGSGAAEAALAHISAPPNISTGSAMRARRTNDVMER
jgi:hypothetical protein